MGDWDRIFGPRDWPYLDIYLDILCEWGYGVTCTVHSPIYVRLVFGSRSTIVQ